MPDDFHLPRAPLDVLDYEIAQEQAVAPATDGAKVGGVLAMLPRFNAAHLCQGAPASVPVQGA